MAGSTSLTGGLVVMDLAGCNVLGQSDGKGAQLVQ